jgi:hypothetical protein
VERCQNTGCTNFAQIAQLGAGVSSYGDSALSASTTYVYRVRAFNSAGNSGYSNTATAITLQSSLPLPPSKLAATVASTSQINLTWKDNSTNESGFKVERCLGTGCTNFAQIAQLGAGVTSYSNTGLTASTTYLYRVQAFNSAGNSAYSNTASTKTSVPAAPSSLTAQASGSDNTKIKLAWTDSSSNETGFKIERCGGSGCTSFTEIDQVGAGATSYSSKNLIPNTTYTYRVRAYNGAGNSAYSNTASAKTLP